MTAAPPVDALRVGRPKRGRRHDPRWHLVVRPGTWSSQMVMLCALTRFDPPALEVCDDPHAAPTCLVCVHRAARGFDV